MTNLKNSGNDAKVRWGTFIIIVALTLYGCAAIDINKMNQLEIGMTKNEVIEIMGNPDSIASQGKLIYFNYMLVQDEHDSYYWIRRPYFVKFINGKVDSFGRKGDFDSTKDPTQVLKIKKQIVSDEKVNIKNSDNANISNKLRELKKLENDGVITHDDFETQKKKILDSYTEDQPSTVE